MCEIPAAGAIARELHHAFFVALLNRTRAEFSWKHPFSMFFSSRFAETSIVGSGASSVAEFPLGAHAVRFDLDGQPVETLSRAYTHLGKSHCI
jgi:hypothetical protein